MALILVTGRANVGKSGRLYGPLIDAARSGREAVLLVPSHAEVVRARAEFSNRAAIGITVDTLDGWATALWALHGDGRRPIDEVSRRISVRAIASGAEAILEGSSRYPGFEELMADVCARSAGMDFAAPEDAISAEVARIVTDYRRSIGGMGLIEPGELLSLLPGVIRGPLPVVSINRFSDFSRQQQAFITGLARSTDVRVGVTHQPDFMATEAMNGVVQAMTEAGGEVIHLAGGCPESELEHFELELFGGHTVVSRGRVSFLEADGPEAEVSAVADAVRATVADGVSARRIAVVFRDVRRRWQPLEAAFDARGLSLDADISLPLPETPLGKTALGMVSLARRRSGGREELVALLSSRFLGADARKVDELDRGWRGRRVDDTRRLLADAGETSETARRIIDAALDLANGGASNGWQRMADFMLEASLLRPVGANASRLDAAAHKAICDSATQLEALPQPVRIDNFLAALEAQSVSTGMSESPGAVLLTEAHRIRGRRFDVVIVGGLAANEFSSEHREPLSARLLRNLGVDVGTDERLSERMLFYTIATRARERLVLVRQAADHRGEPLRPSLFWDECIDLYQQPDSEVVSAPLRRVGITEPHESTPYFTRGRAELKRRAYQGEIVPPRTSRGTLTRPLPAREPEEYSVTEIETYLSCPYRWFYDRTVRPRELDRSFDAAEKGSTAHRLLAETYRALRSEGVPRIAPETLAHAHEVLLEQARRLSAESRIGLRGVAEGLSWDQAVRWALAVLEQDQEFLLEFRPIEEEYRFGSQVGRPFCIGDVALKGSVDRIDSGLDGAVITDYKSSEVQGSGTWMKNGLLQPIVYSMVVEELTGSPVVAAIYRSLSRGEVRGFWDADLAPPEPALSPRDVGDARTRVELIEWAQEAVAGAVDGMRAGSIPRRPTDKACSFCGAREFCEERR